MIRFAFPHRRNRPALAAAAVFSAIAVTGCGVTIDASRSGAEQPSATDEGPVTVTSIVERPADGAGNRPEPTRHPQATRANENAGDTGMRGSDNPMGFATSVPTSSGTVRASSPSCDSRGILILESVLVHPGDDARSAIGAALDRNPGSEFTVPGACPSLRSRVDGADVYAVYVDYGNDTGALCSAAARTGGNARVLSDRAEYVSPC